MKLLSSSVASVVTSLLLLAGCASETGELGPDVWGGNRVTLRGHAASGVSIPSGSILVAEWYLGTDALFVQAGTFSAQSFDFDLASPPPTVEPLPDGTVLSSALLAFPAGTPIPTGLVNLLDPEASAFLASRIASVDNKQLVYATSATAEEPQGYSCRTYTRGASPAYSYGACADLELRPVIRNEEAE